MPSLTQQLLLVLDPPKREGRFLLPGNDRRPADISLTGLMARTLRGEEKQKVEEEKRRVEEERLPTKT